MKETPILYTGEMVRAILDGRKAMTRRVVKPQPWLIVGQDAYGNVDDAGYWRYGEEKEDWPWPNDCPYGVIGDRLWVREKFNLMLKGTEKQPGFQRQIEYHSDGEIRDISPDHNDDWDRMENSKRGYLSRPSIFMPRWASRITIEITDIRVERLQDISEEDALMEGVTPSEIGVTNRTCFRILWDSINVKKHPWTSNPWVWVVGSKRI